MTDTRHQSHPYVNHYRCYRYFSNKKYILISNKSNLYCSLIQSSRYKISTSVAFLVSWKISSKYFLRCFKRFNKSTHGILPTLFLRNLEELKMFLGAANENFFVLKKRLNLSFTKSSDKMLCDFSLK